MTRRAMTGTAISWIRGLMIVSGVAIVSVAAVGLVRNLGYGYDHYVRFLVVGWLANDLLVLPVAIVIGFLAGRRLPRWAKPVVQAALFISAAVVVVALPLIIGPGQNADIPSALPRSYGRNLLITLAVVWLVAGAIMALRRRRRGDEADVARPGGATGG